MTSSLLLRRKTVNAVMLTLTGLCTLFATGTLIFILGYLFIHGGKSLSWNFFTKLPTPVGETGGGMANAIAGSVYILLIASFFGVPLGIGAGIVVVWGIDLLEYLRIDDPIGAVPVHMVAGIWGTLSLGLFAAGKYGAESVAHPQMPLAAPAE